MKTISLHGLETIPEVKEGDDVAALILEACTREQIHLTTGDVVIVTSKIVSKAEGRTINLREVKPSRRARAIARITGKDPVEVEIVLRESKDIRAVIPLRKIADNFPEVFGSMASDDKNNMERLLAEEPAFLVTTTKVAGGLMSTDAGLDYSNNPSGRCTVLPLNAGGSASAIRARLLEICGADVAVVITDTEVSFTHLYLLGYDALKDLEVLALALERFPNAIGLIASASKREHLFAQLRDRGVAREALARVRSPVGLPIGAESPPEIAVSIVAEVVRELHPSSLGSRSRQLSQVTPDTDAVPRTP